MNYTDTEIWIDVKGYEGFYLVSNHGRIKSLDRYVPRWHGVLLVKGQILSTKPNITNGYVSVKLYRDSDKSFKMLKVHRIVAESFLSNPEGKDKVNHINGIKHDNHVSNLEWVTQKENMHHAFDNGLINHKRGSDHRCAKVIYEFDLDGLLLNEYQSVIDAANFKGGKPRTIAAAARGTSKSAYGSVWRYACS